MIENKKLRWFYGIAFLASLIPLILSLNIFQLTSLGYFFLWLFLFVLQPVIQGIKFFTLPNKLSAKIASWSILIGYLLILLTSLGYLNFFPKGVVIDFSSFKTMLLFFAVSFIIALVSDVTYLFKRNADKKK